LASRSECTLVTGGAGFTGRRLMERLRHDGHDVVALRKPSESDDDNRSIAADLCDLQGLTDALTHSAPRAIIHLAAVAAPTHSDVAEIYSTNVTGTANLFAAITAAKLEPDLVIIASSAQVYAIPSDTTAITEENALRPLSHYAVSKRASEDIAKLYADRFRIIVTRPFNYTGPGQTETFLVPKIVRHFVERRGKIRLGNLDLFRDISDIDRAIEAYSRLATGKIASIVVNICSGRAIHLSDILTMMADISGHELRVETDHALIRDGEPRYIVGSPVRLESLLGPLPNPEFHQTLTRIYNAMRESAFIRP